MLYRLLSFLFFFILIFFNVSFVLLLKSMRRIGGGHEWCPHFVYFHSWRFMQFWKARHSLNCSQRALLYSVSTISLPGLYFFWEIWILDGMNIRKTFPLCFALFCLFVFILGLLLNLLSGHCVFIGQNPSLSVGILLFAPIQEGGAGKFSWDHQGTFLTWQQVLLGGTWWQKNTCKWNEQAKGNYLGKPLRKNSSRTLYLPNRLRWWFCWLQRMTILAKLFSVKP